MQNSEFGHSDREFLVAAIPRIEDKTMPGAVHGFQAPFLLLNVKSEHVVFVVLPMAGGFPELAAEHIGGDHCTSRISLVLRI